MEYCRLGDLARVRNREGPFSEKTTGLVARQVLEGIRFMHEINFAHRDLKPGVSNLFMILSLVTHCNTEYPSSIHIPLACQNCGLWH